MDLFKAFDCLPHDLLVEKIETYAIDKTDFMQYTTTYQTVKSEQK